MKKPEESALCDQCREGFGYVLRLVGNHLLALRASDGELSVDEQTIRADMLTALESARLMLEDHGHHRLVLCVEELQHQVEKDHLLDRLDAVRTARDEMLELANAET